MGNIITPQIWLVKNIKIEDVSTIEDSSLYAYYNDEGEIAETEIVKQLRESFPTTCVNKTDDEIISIIRDTLTKKYKAKKAIEYPDIRFKWRTETNGCLYLYSVSNIETRTLEPLRGNGLEEITNSIKSNREYYQNIKTLASSAMVTEEEYIDGMFEHLKKSQEHQIMEEPLSVSTDITKWNYVYIDITKLVEGKTPAWNEFTSRLDMPDLFMVWVGSLLHFENRSIRRLCWLQGLDGEDGKSIVLQCISEFIYGTSNKSKWGSITSNTLNGRFLGSLVHCKPFLVYFDNQHNLKFLSSQNVFSMLGGDPMPVEYKGEDTIIIDGYRRIIVASNYAPEYNPQNNSEASRIVVIKVKPTNKRDYEWKNRLLNEMPHFMYKCHQMYLSRVKHGQNIELTQEEKDISTEQIFSNNQNVVDEFFQKFTFEEGAYTLASEFSRAMNEAFIDMSVKREEEMFFSKAIQTYLYKNGIVLKQIKKENSKRGWIGIRFKNKPHNKITKQEAII